MKINHFVLKTLTSQFSRLSMVSKTWNFVSETTWIKLLRTNQWLPKSYHFCHRFSDCMAVFIENFPKLSSAGWLETFKFIDGNNRNWYYRPCLYWLRVRWNFINAFWLNSLKLLMTTYDRSRLNISIDSTQSLVVRKTNEKSKIHNTFVFFYIQFIALFFKL